MTMEIAGRDTISGLPRKIVITSEEIREAFREPIAGIIEAVMRTLERAEPELAADLIENGVTLCGGGSLLRGMDKVLANATGLRVVHAEDPLTCARGTSVFGKSGVVEGHAGFDQPLCSNLNAIADVCVCADFGMSAIRCRTKQTDNRNH